MGELCLRSLVIKVEDWLRKGFVNCYTATCNLNISGSLLFVSFLYFLSIWNELHLALHIQNLLP